jgi:peptidyl-prolyl cis-trans isomerase C
MTFVITEARIAEELQHHPAATREEAWQKAESALRIRMALLAEARRLGLAASEDGSHDGALRETEEESLIRQILDCNLRVPDISDEACRTEYDRQPGRFRSPALFEAAHILIAADMASPEARSLARHQAEELAALVVRQPAQFPHLAREHSACPSGSDGGGLGQITPRDVTPEIATMLLVMEPGTICPIPVPTRHGYHILRLDRREIGRELPFEAVRDQIRDHLRRRSWLAAARRYAVTLINTDPDDLECAAICDAQDREFVS